MDLLLRFQVSYKYPCNPALYVLVGHIYSRLRKISIVPAVVCK